MDTVGDLLTRIKNAYASRKGKTILSYSKQSLAIAELLVKEGYLVSLQEVVAEGKRFKHIEVELKYSENKPVVTDIKRVSKPGLRVYSKGKTLPRVLNGMGIAIISTPKGIMSDKKARKEGLGGEVMAYVW